MYNIIRLMHSVSVGSSNNFDITATKVTLPGYFGSHTI